MKKWIGAAVALLFFVGLLAFLLPILGWQKQLDQESAEYEALSSAVQLSQASEPPVVTPSEADSSVLNDLISSLDGDVLSEDIPASSAPARTSSIDLEACKAQNSDFAAWLSIPKHARQLSCRVHLRYRLLSQTQLYRLDQLSGNAVCHRRYQLQPTIPQHRHLWSQYPLQTDRDVQPADFLQESRVLSGASDNSSGHVERRLYLQGVRRV